MYKIVRKVLQLYSYNMEHVQELQRNDPAASEPHAFRFHVRIEMNEHWSSNVLWTD